ncbi:MAG: CDP-glucose 4,6-dehydratase [Draconibacterium sp.]
MEITDKSFSGIFASKKVLITGNTGFKGSWLTAWLLKLGANIVGYSKDIPTHPSMFEELHLEKEIKQYFANVQDADKLSEVIQTEKPDFIFHLAAQPIVKTSYEDPLETLQTNVIGTANVLDALRTVEHKCVAIFITSDKCYENVEWVWGYKETDHLGGKDIYSASKGAAENVIHAYFHSFIKNKPNIRMSSVRAGNVIGGGDWAASRIVPDCMKAWSKKQSVEIRSPRATRPWQHVLEPLSGYLRIAENLWFGEKQNGESFNFGPASEISLTVEEILHELSDYWDFNAKEDAYTVNENSDFHEAGLLKLNCDKALYYLKWAATLSASECLEFTSKWYYNFYHKPETDIKKYTLDQIEKYKTIAEKKNLAWTK